LLLVSSIHIPVSARRQPQGLAFVSTINYAEQVFFSLKLKKNSRTQILFPLVFPPQENFPEIPFDICCRMRIYINTRVSGCHKIICVWLIFN
jgi:hypothetical protein